MGGGDAAVGLRHGDLGKRVRNIEGVGVVEVGKDGSSEMVTRGKSVYARNRVSLRDKSLSSVSPGPTVYICLAMVFVWYCSR